jgi:hypothetical protein
MMQFNLIPAFIVAALLLVAVGAGMASLVWWFL